MDHGLGVDIDSISSLRALIDSVVVVVVFVVVVVVAVVLGRTLNF